MASSPNASAVTGAFSYTGAYIARALLERGERVTTLSRRPDPGHPLSARVRFARLQFEDPDALAASLEGARTLYNTYWIRFPRRGMTFARAVANTRVLLGAAARAEVRRIVHGSVSNPAEDSALDYFRHKALAERAVAESGLSFAVVRPTLIFGREDILLHNIAWSLRRFPLWTIPGDGRYRIQPVAAEDVARLALEAAAGDEALTVDAAGAETLSFEALVRLIAGAVGARARLVHAPPAWARALANLVAATRGDVMLTREELTGLQQELLVSHQPPQGRVSFTEWVARHGHDLGARYVSERGRNWSAAPR
jgi:uncharacterized protein YbjT (DUF2867 family)